VQTYVLRRVLLCAPTLLLITVMAFFLIRLVPGDVITAKLAQSGNLSVGDISKARHQLGLDAPFYVQYVRFVKGVVTGNPGRSLYSSKPVASEFIDALPVSIELGIIAMVISLCVAVPAGLISAIKKDTPFDYTIRFFAILGNSLPDFWMGVLLIVILSLWFHYLPALGYVPFFKDPMKNLGQFYLPALVIGYRLSAYTMRMLRSSMLDVLHQDYVRTARAKGLRSRMVILRHAVKNALIPVVTVWGGQLAFVFGGTLILEVIFALPGVGRLTFEAIGQRDYTQIQFNVLAIGTIVLLINLCVDLVYGWLDPRIRFS
jgi:peptide/nickel transport system permease protein